MFAPFLNQNLFNINNNYIRPQNLLQNNAINYKNI